MGNIQPTFPRMELNLVMQNEASALVVSTIDFSDHRLQTQKSPEKSNARSHVGDESLHSREDEQAVKHAQHEKYQEELRRQIEEKRRQKEEQQRKEDGAYLVHCYVVL